MQDCGQVCHFDDPSEFGAVIDEETIAVFVETIGNPTYVISPISEIANVCDLYTCVHILRLYAGYTRTLIGDNTFDMCVTVLVSVEPTPDGCNCQGILSVLKHGANIVVHSATKWIGG